MRQWKKSLNDIKGTLLSKGKPKVIFLYTEQTSLRRLESGSITDYIIRTENISNALKEAGEVISDGLLMILRGLPPNFKPFTTVISQKKKVLTFSEFKVCVRSYEETEHMCSSPDKSNKILQKKTTFGKINTRNKPGVSMHSCYDYKSTIIITITRNLSIVEQTIKFTPQGRQIFMFVGGWNTKHLTVDIEGKVIFVII